MILDKGLTFPKQTKHVTNKTHASIFKMYAVFNNNICRVNSVKKLIIYKYIKHVRPMWSDSN